MKIAFYSIDPGNHRFITPIIERLQAKGYECQLYHNWTIDNDASIYWFDFCDNNLIVATREDKEHLKSKKVIARLHAVEAYLQFYKQIDWECVDHLVFVSEHLREKCSDIQYPTNLKIHTIHNGIDLSKFTFRERSINGAKYIEPWNFGYIGNIVPQKGLLTFLHYFSTVKAMEASTELYLAGLSRMSGREGEYWDHAKHLIGSINEEGDGVDTDKWLDEHQINYLVQPSYAESFSLIVAEAMAKGIKPLINNYWGSDRLWPKELIYSNFKEFCDILEAPYESKKYREWVEQRYNIEDQIKKIEELL